MIPPVAGAGIAAGAPASAGAGSAPAGLPATVAADGLAPAAGLGPPAAAAAESRRPARASDRAPQAARIAVLGASGYAGQEFARLALAHPGLQLAALCSREQAGRPACELLPGVDPRVDPLPPVLDPEALEERLAAGAFDTLVCCLPHGAWKQLAAERPALADGPARVVDLSSDFRDGRVPAAGGWDYVYGLPEAFRLEIPAATRVANPGCYPTAAALALLPAAEWIAGPVMVSALSGVSGAGRAPQLRTSFVELDGGAALYRAGTEHAHVPEMERTLARLAGRPVPVGFAPQLAPMARGILLTATAPLARPVSPGEARDAYLARYEGEPFVRVLAAGTWPETRAVRSSNRCDVAVTTLHGGTTLLAAAALDNLVKGAAGQAVQNLNLMLGWPEEWGLPTHGTPW
ncbi:MAG: N-acetyl-gamma-glutamyl-phosphate reductase [Candidatus Eisenbacteria bacterium]|nr:N-acetyl-gamma-glutamyl-phosphate reductase [Candidatus Eisenbacteria bacterium]